MGDRVARDGDFAFQVKGRTCGHAEAEAVYNNPELNGTLPAGTKEIIVKLRIIADKNQVQTFFDSNQGSAVYR